MICRPTWVNAIAAATPPNARLRPTVQRSGSRRVVTTSTPSTATPTPSTISSLRHVVTARSRTPRSTSRYSPSDATNGSPRHATKPRATTTWGHRRVTGSPLRSRHQPSTSSMPMAASTARPNAITYRMRENGLPENPGRAYSASSSGPPMNTAIASTATSTAHVFRTESRCRRSAPRRPNALTSTPARATTITNVPTADTPSNGLSPMYHGPRSGTPSARSSRSHQALMRPSGVASSERAANTSLYPSWRANGTALTALRRKPSPTDPPNAAA